MYNYTDVSKTHNNNLGYLFGFNQVDLLKYNIISFGNRQKSCFFNNMFMAKSFTQIIVGKMSKTKHDSKFTYDLLVVCVLWHIDLYRLFYAKSIQYK